MKDIVLNFEKKSFTAIPEYYCCEYPKPAAGWHEQVYYPRSIQITNNYPVKTDLEGLKMTNKSWDEIGAALNMMSKPARITLTLKQYIWCLKLLMPTISFS